MTTVTRLKTAVLVSVAVFTMLLLGFAIGYEAGGNVTVTLTQWQTITITSYNTQTIYTSTSTTVTYTVTLLPPPQTSTYESKMLIVGTIRQELSIGPWKVAVLNVSEGLCAKVQPFHWWYWQGKYDYWRYFKAPPGMKIVVVRMMFRNVADYRVPLYEFTSTSTRLESPVIVTDTGERYSQSSIQPLEPIPSESVIKSIEHLCVEYRELDTTHELAPGETIVGDFIFIIPQACKT